MPATKANSIAKANPAVRAPAPAEQKPVITKAELLRRIASAGDNHYAIKPSGVRVRWTKPLATAAVRTLSENGVVIGDHQLAAAGHDYLAQAIPRFFGSRGFEKARKAAGGVSNPRSVFRDSALQASVSALQAFREQAAVLRAQGVSLTSYSRDPRMKPLQRAFAKHGRNWGLPWPELIKSSCPGMSDAEFNLDHSRGVSHLRWKHETIFEALRILNYRHGEPTIRKLKRIRQMGVYAAVKREPTLGSLKKAWAKADINGVLRRQLRAGGSLTLEGLTFINRSAVLGELGRRFSGLPVAEAFQRLKQDAGVELHPAYDPRKHFTNTRNEDDRSKQRIADVLRSQVYHSQAAKVLGISVDELCNEVAEINKIVRAELQNGLAAQKPVANAAAVRLEKLLGIVAKLNLDYDWEANEEELKLPPLARAAIFALKKAKRLAIEPGAKPEEANFEVRKAFAEYLERKNLSHGDLSELYVQLKQAIHHHSFVTTGGI